MTPCNEPLPCGIRDGAWARHVCELPRDHADVDSPCRCAICDPARCNVCGSLDPETRYLIGTLGDDRPHECVEEFHGPA